MNTDQSIRDHVLYLFRGGGAHIDFESLIADYPIGIINHKAEGVPYTPWQLLEHMRLTQWDIVKFTIDPTHVSPDFPVGYWPAPGALADADR